jgi:hypothetical protein
MSCPPAVEAGGEHGARAAGRAGGGIMAKRSSQSFVKRQKEMARKERAQLKNQKRLERKLNKGEGGEEEILVPLDGPILHETFADEPEAETTEVAVEETAAKS